MNIGEIISDALAYPLNNIKSLVLFVILGVVAAVIGGSTLVSIVAGLNTKGLASGALTGMGVIGLIIFIILLFLVEGYALDIIKYGIERRNDGPGIEFERQITNAFKLIVVDIVYYLVPAIITFVLGLFLRNWLITIISIILFIIFALANFMAKCRLAKTDDIGYALAIGEAIGDITRVGIAKLIVVAALVFIITFIIVLIVGIIGSINDIVGNILLGIALVYIIFFYHRAIGLLYSEV